MGCVSGGPVATQAGCWSMWPSRSPTERAPSATCRLWLISTACTARPGRLPRPRRSGGSWTASTASCSPRSAGPGRWRGTGRGWPVGNSPERNCRARGPPAHSDKQGAKGYFKGGFGYHPLGAWLDNTGEALAAVLRPGNAGSNTATDHLIVLELALTQLPDRWRDKPILIRADGAGYSHALISALWSARVDFSVGYPVTEAVRDAIGAVPKWAWQSASKADGGPREHADVVDVTALLDLSRWHTTCPGMRIIVRREHPHPGATLDAFGFRTASVPVKILGWGTCRPGTRRSTLSGPNWR